MTQPCRVASRLHTTKAAERGPTHVRVSSRPSTVAELLGAQMVGAQTVSGLSRTVSVSPLQVHSGGTRKRQNVRTGKAARCFRSMCKMWANTANNLSPRASCSFWLANECRYGWAIGSAAL